MRKKTIDQLVDEAHQYFGESSIFEIIDKDDSQAREYLNTKYNNPDLERVEAYLEVVRKVRQTLC